ncbi:MAG: 4-hydroxythreonine-4-phosphate dehydrogenase PdxA [Acidobacteriota bacterium]
MLPKVPFIGITLGDPAGIGKEIILKSMSKFVGKYNFLIIGSSDVIENERKKLKLEIPLKLIENFNSPVKNGFYVFDVFPKYKIENGVPSKKSGLLSFMYLKEATSLISKGKIDVLVTAPISKKAWEMNDIKYRGHTEYFKDYFKKDKIIMSFWSTNLKVALFTDHVALKDIFRMVKKDLILESLLFLDDELKKLGFSLKIFVCALNPHAGENGFLGNEEIEEIIPAVQLARKKGVNVEGPFSSDSLFFLLKNRRDVIVFSFYHDQALAPFKLISFRSGVNLTLGLPFIRTSPVHGTAFDIAGRGIADPTSMEMAIKFGAKLSFNKCVSKNKNNSQ